MYLIVTLVSIEGRSKGVQSWLVFFFYTCTVSDKHGRRVMEKAIALAFLLQGISGYRALAARRNEGRQGRCCRGMLLEPLRILVVTGNGTVVS